MGKYSKMNDPQPRDYWPTIDPRAVQALLPHLEDNTAYCEPCAGKGDLIDQLADHGHWCIYACDIEPQREDIEKRDARTISIRETETWDCYITNPPFSRKMLLPLIPYLSSMLPTWLLLPADVMHNKYMAEHMEYCQKVVSIGRLWWKENKMTGKDNYCWFLFDMDYNGPTTFYERQ